MPDQQQAVTRTIHLETQEATQAFGRHLGASLPPGQVVALSGNLGAGKTTLTQSIAEGMGIPARITSPTFTLINQYPPGERRLLLVHIDTYRLGEGSSLAIAEAEGLGLVEILDEAALGDSHSDGAIIVIEWAERVAPLLPSDTLYIQLVTMPDNEQARTATLTTTSSQVVEVLQLF